MTDPQARARARVIAAGAGASTVHTARIAAAVEALRIAKERLCKCCEPNNRMLDTLITELEGREAK